VFAVAIFAVGVIGILRLFPVGLDAHRDFVGETCSAETAEHLFQALAFHLKDPTDDYANWSDLGQALPAAKPPGPEPTNWTVWDQAGDTTIWRGQNNPEYMRVELRAPDAAAADFSAVCRLWRSPVSWWQYEDGAWVERTLGPEAALALNLEIAWPATLAPETRRAALYRLEVFKPE